LHQNGYDYIKMSMDIYRVAYYFDYNVTEWI